MVIKEGQSCKFIKDMEIIKQGEMGHNRNKTSYNCNIKEMNTKLQLRESGKYKRGR